MKDIHPPVKKASCPSDSPISTKDEGAVSILGLGVIEGFEDQALPQGVGQVLLSTDHVGDTHLSIIHCWVINHTRQLPTNKPSQSSMITVQYK